MWLLLGGLTLALILRHWCGIHRKRVNERQRQTNILQIYHDSYVEVPAASMSRAQGVVSRVKQEILSHFHSNFPELNITGLTDSGSYREGLNVIAPDEFDVTFTLLLDSMPWKLETSRDTPGFFLVGRQTDNVLFWKFLAIIIIIIIFDNYVTGLLLVPGFFLVGRQTNNVLSWMFLSIIIIIIIIDNYVTGLLLVLGLVYIFAVPKRHSPYDKYIVKGYLSPQMLVQDFQVEVQKALNNLSSYEFTINRQGPAITLHMWYGRWMNQMLDIDLVPTLEIQKTLLVAKPYRKVLQLKGNPRNHNLLWRQSYSGKEHDLLASAPGNYRQVLKIIKAVRLNVSHFGKFSSYVYKMVLMEMIKKGLANQRDSLLKCFEKFLQKSEIVFSKKELPHVFNDKINVLEEYPPIACADLGLLISNLLKSGDFHKLLEQTQYTGLE